VKFSLTRYRNGWYLHNETNRIVLSVSTKHMTTNDYGEAERLLTKVLYFVPIEIVDTTAYLIHHPSFSGSIGVSISNVLSFLNHGGTSV